jgi:hypothetical protein
MLYLCSAHGAGPLPIEPGGDALLAEDVLAVKDGRLLKRVVTNRTRIAARLHLLKTRASAVSLKQLIYLNKKGLICEPIFEHRYFESYLHWLVFCINYDTFTNGSIIANSELFM